MFCITVKSPSGYLIGTAAGLRERVILSNENLALVEQNLILHYGYDYSVHFMAHDEITKHYIEEMRLSVNPDNEDSQKWRNDLPLKDAELLADLESMTSNHIENLV